MNNAKHTTTLNFRKQISRNEEKRAVLEMNEVEDAGFILNTEAELVDLDLTLQFKRSILKERK